MPGVFGAIANSLKPSDPKRIGRAKCLVLLEDGIMGI